MQITEKKTEKLEHSKVRLTATVPAAELRSIYDEMMKEYTRTVRMDGFRVGHVPASVLERKFGDTLRLDAMGRVLEKAVDESLKDVAEKPLAYEAPALEGAPEFAIDKDFTFSVTYDIFPVFELPSTDNLEISVPDVKIEQADIDRELEQIRQRNAIVMEKTGPAAAGDLLTVNFAELDEAGNPIASTERQDFTFELGKGHTLYHFEEELTGMAAGETRTFSKTYPADFEHTELAGREVKLTVTLTKVKQRDLPELDDELAQDVSEKYKTLADLIASVTEQLQSALDTRLRDSREKAIVETLLARTKVDVPESMVSAELSMRWDSLKREMGIDTDEKMERIAAYSGKTREQLYEDWKPAVSKAIAGRILLDKLVESANIVISEEDLTAEYARQARDGSLSAEEVRAEYENSKSVDYLKDHMKESRYFDALIASATVKTAESVSFVDFMGRSE